MSIKEIIRHPKMLYISATNRGLTSWVPDELHIRLLWRIKRGCPIDLKCPKTYMEKLQWLKLHDRNPMYTTMVDKLEMKSWVSKKIGSQYVVPVYSSWDCFDDINPSNLPNRFVLKTTNDSSGLSVCKEKSSFDWDSARQKVNASLRRNYFDVWREWPYKNVKPRVFAEALLEERGSCQDGVLTDYKFFCFNGVPKIMYVSQDASISPHTDFFDMNFNHLSIRMADPNADILPPKPKKFEEMKSLAAKLSEGIPHVRVDFYCVNDCVYVGELTFYHNAGFSEIEPEEWDQRMGDWIDLSLAYGA